MRLLKSELKELLWNTSNNFALEYFLYLYYWIIGLLRIATSYESIFFLLKKAVQSLLSISVLNNPWLV